jgi:CHAT domain-containing protein
MGRNLRGEGLLGLSRGFLQAGARGLLASLWRVSDCSTADLVTGFFSGLKKDARGGPEALRAAKLELMRRREYAHPYYWSAFVLLGTPGGASASRP